MCQPRCCLDVRGLRAFVARAEEDDECGPALQKVDAVAGAVVDPQLTDAVAEGFHIPEMTEGQSIQSRRDQRPRTMVTKL